MSVDRPGETEAQLVDRRGRESEARWAAWDAEVAARRAAGIPDVPCALLPAIGGGFDYWEGSQGRPRRGNWGT